MFTRQGHSPGVQFPRVLGIEAVGLVEEAPGGECRQGDQVATAMGGMGRQFDGGYAEYTCVPAVQVQAFKTGGGHRQEPRGLRGGDDAQAGPRGAPARKRRASTPPSARSWPRCSTTGRRIVASVCHGPARSCSRTGVDETWLFKGRALTACTNDEESQATLAGNAP